MSGFPTQLRFEDALGGRCTGRRQPALAKRTHRIGTGARTHPCAGRDRHVSVAAVRQQCNGRHRLPPRGSVSAQVETGLRLVGEQFAGVRQDLVVGPGECVRITTGAPLPPGADTVAIREALRMDGEQVLIPKALRLAGALTFDMRAKTCVPATGCFGRAMR